MFSKLAVAATVALSVLSPVLADCTRNYTVVEGDWCDTIGASQNVSTYQIEAVNYGIIDSTCSNLEPGQNLCLGTTGEDCTTTYVVKADDSCQSITTQFNLNSTILSLNNPNIDDACDNLYIGEVLCVSTTVVAPPIPSGFFSTSTPTTTPDVSDNAGSDGGDDSGDDGTDDGDDDDTYCDDTDESD